MHKHILKPASVIVLALMAGCGGSETASTNVPVGTAENAAPPTSSKVVASTSISSVLDGLWCGALGDPDGGYNAVCLNFERIMPNKKLGTVILINPNAPNRKKVQVDAPYTVAGSAATITIARGEWVLTHSLGSEVMKFIDPTTKEKLTLKRNVK